MKTDRIEELTNKALDEDQSLTADEWLELASLTRDGQGWDVYRQILDTEVVLRGLDSRLDVGDRVMAELDSMYGKQSLLRFPRNATSGALLAAAAIVVLAVGWWLLDRPDARLVQRVAAMAELHYATSVTDTDVVRDGLLLVGAGTRRYDILNLTLASAFQLGDGRFSVRPGAVLPLRDGDDRQFDYEFFVQVNRVF